MTVLRQKPTTPCHDMLRNVEKIGPKEVRLRRRTGPRFPAALTVSVLPLQKFCLLVTDLSQQQHYDELVRSRKRRSTIEPDLVNGKCRGFGTIGA